MANAGVPWGLGKPEYKTIRAVGGECKRLRCLRSKVDRNARKGFTVYPKDLPEGWRVHEYPSLGTLPATVGCVFYPEKLCQLDIFTIDEPFCVLVDTLVQLHRLCGWARNRVFLSVGEHNACGAAILIGVVSIGVVVQ